MQELTRNGIVIDDTFAEAFGMRATAIIITAPTLKWARQAAITMTGFATSVIGCGCEAAIDIDIPASETPDGRPGCRVMIFAMSTDDLQKQLKTRLGQCVLTSPGSACFADLKGSASLDLGSSLRYFGDGWQISKKFGGRHYWRVPVMDGEFLCEAKTGLTKDAVGGGNFLLLAADAEKALAAAERAVAAIEKVPGAIMPFPGGIVRSGSKVGGKYKGMMASTNDAYAPTLRGVVKSALGPEINAVLEIVIDGENNDAVNAAMRAGLKAVIDFGPKRGALRISAGNYGGKLGKFHYHLKDLLP
ncbi:formylmethanofuran--tetrahydromethanopterin N-formyltransferase [Neorhizobium sp. Rsf11]|uniref:Formylmethanofuran--tetrahydromethanopterin formyltransferase n=2 Tax=Neorhizobium TaxID=1525371 RepID=A0ABV0M1Z1_9HYPH|nr:formylmethanofuran--tetrahydromethanopterin N-formyltransferase [Neorhizobium petrolearium]MCC2611957.1 formylmethanofuran--tetrahydromethanopterin N-formyltransferase [Neorhizobium petrolearium]WGI67118.1 formylmethanofuran--tetrahydromethanopterin N-formyltransferase [Neorhizobium petrolearium]